MGISKRWLFYTVALVLLWTPGTWAQDAQLSGRVVDASGGVIAKAAVSVWNKDTGLKRSTATNDDGLYVVTSLLPGIYDITVQASGFQAIAKTGIKLDVAQNARLDFALQVGSSQTTISVTGEAPLATTDDASVGTVVNRQFVANMPLNGRSFQSLIGLVPGVLVVNAGNNGGQFSVNGQRPDTNYFMVDGVSANAGLNGVQKTQGSFSTGGQPATSATGGFNTLVSVDDLQEFKIQTSTFAPEYGRNPGAQVSILTRSGSNQFHGDLFDYLRNTSFDANDWISNSKHIAQAPEHQNDFGGVFGGPILKDRLFFFFSYEGLRLRQPTVRQFQVPSIAARNTATPLSPLINLFPLPDPGAAVSGDSSSATISRSLPQTIDNASIRFDYNLTDRMTIFGRYNHSPSLLTFIQGIFPSRDQTAFDVLTLGYTYAISSTLTNDLRFNWTGTSGGTSIQGPAFSASLASEVLPTAQTLANGGIAIGFGGGPSPFAGQSILNKNTQYNIIDTVSHSIGAHQIKVGMDYRRLTPTQGDVNSNLVLIDLANTSAGGTAPWISGVVDVLQRQRNASERYLINNFSLFAQDTWKATSRFTVTYGLRWDVNPPAASSNGRPFFSINNSLTNPAGLLVSVGPSIYSTSYDNFAPRVGGAYQINKDPKWGTVLRAGFGVFYDTASTANGTVTGPYSAQAQLGGQVFPFSGAAIVQPVIPQTAPYGTSQVTAPNLQLPYTDQWNVAWEQNLGNNQSLSVTYVGAIGRRLLRNESYFGYAPNSLPGPGVPPFSSVGVTDNSGHSNYNSLQLQLKKRMAKGLQVLGSYTWSHSLDDVFPLYIVNPTAFAALAPGKIEGSGISPAQLGQFSSLGYSSSDFDVRQVFSVAVSYDAPSFSTDHYMNAIFGHWGTDFIFHYSTPLPLTPVAGTAGSVLPSLTGGAGGFPANQNVAVPLYLYGAACNTAFGKVCPGGKGINPAAFPYSPTPNGAINNPLTADTYGTAGRNSVRGYPLTQLDVTLRRSFPIVERYRLEFRADAFNIFNHANFGVPFNNVGVPALFGLPTTTNNNASNIATGFSPLYAIGGPRSLQLSLKFVF